MHVRELDSWIDECGRDSERDLLLAASITPRSASVTRSSCEKAVVEMEVSVVSCWSLLHNEKKGFLFEVCLYFLTEKLE